MQAQKDHDFIEKLKPPRDYGTRTVTFALPTFTFASAARSNRVLTRARNCQL